MSRCVSVTGNIPRIRGVPSVLETVGDTVLCWLCALPVDGGAPSDNAPLSINVTVSSIAAPVCVAWPIVSALVSAVATSTQLVASFPC